MNLEVERLASSKHYVYYVGHTNLNCDQWLQRDPIAFCPQSFKMIPKEMIVRDILLLACVMMNVDL